MKRFKILIFCFFVCFVVNAQNNVAYLDSLYENGFVSCYGNINNSDKFKPAENRIEEQSKELTAITEAVELAKHIIDPVGYSYELLFKSQESNLVLLIETAETYKKIGDKEAYEKQLKFIERYKNSMEKSRREKEQWDIMLKRTTSVF